MKYAGEEAALERARLNMAAGVPGPADVEAYVQAGLMSREEAMTYDKMWPSGGYKPGPKGTVVPSTSSPSQTTKGGAYVLRDPENGEVMRCGRSCDLDRRQGEHSRDPKLENYKFDPIYKTDDPKAQRGLEQHLHETHNPPLDKINPVSPNNPNLGEYLKAARDYLNGQ